MNIKQTLKNIWALNFSDDALVQKHYSLTEGVIDGKTYRGGEEWFLETAPGQFFTYKGHGSSLNAFQRCPPLAAIVTRQAQAFINGKTWVLNSQGKEATSRDAEKIRQLFLNPNPLQSGKQFEAQVYMSTRLFGYAVILPIKPFGFESNLDATSLWNVPPHMIEIIETNKLYYQSEAKGVIDKIILTYKGVRTVLKPEDVFIVRDFVPSFESVIIPESRIRPLEFPINNVIGAYESRNVLIKSRGPMYVISSNESDATGGRPMKPEAREQVLKDFKNRYGLQRQQSMAIITSANIKMASVGFSTRDLLLMEEVQESSIAICNGLNYPPFLLGLTDSTYNNQNTAEKGLYQNAIIPDAESIYEQWNQFFFGRERSNLRIEKDYKHVAVLQEDDLANAQARKARNEALKIEFEHDLITVNRWLVLNGEDPRPDGDVYFSQIKDKIAINGNNNTPPGTQPQANGGGN